MIVEAVRDDGALMVTAGDAGAVVLPDGQVFYLPKDSILARGNWTPARPGVTVPAGIDPVKLAAARPAPIASA